MGKLTVDGATLENYFDRGLPVPVKGPIQLQTHGGEIRWRNVFIRSIGSEEANQLLEGRAQAGFTPIFNGKNFDGWTGPLDCCDITNGVIAWLPKKGGTIYTKPEFTTLLCGWNSSCRRAATTVWRFVIPVRGITAYVGMCESQVLDDNYEKATGQAIDPRQAHGSAPTV